MKTRTIVTLAAATVALVGVSVIALTAAAEGPRGGGWGCARGMGYGPAMMGGGHGMMGRGAGFALFDRLDTDGDGRIGAEEGRAAIRDGFTAYDTDGDGTLTLDEFAPLHAELMRPRTVDAFQRLDADGDGSVTVEDMQAPFDRMLVWGDADGDGALGPGDRRAFMDGNRGPRR